MRGTRKQGEADTGNKKFQSEKMAEICISNRKKGISTGKFQSAVRVLVLSTLSLLYSPSARTHQNRTVVLLVYVL